MKNIRISQVLLLMSLAIGSNFTVQAYNDTNKYSHDKTKQGKQKAKAFANGKQDMKAIERDLKKIKKEFNKSHNASQANDQLDSIPARIKKAVQEMKAHEQAGRMWETHEHTLNRKLKEIRKFVKEYVQENKEVVIQQVEPRIILAQAQTQLMPKALEAQAQAGAQAGA